MARSRSWSKVWLLPGSAVLLGVLALPVVGWRASRWFEAAQREATVEGPKATTSGEAYALGRTQA